MKILLISGHGANDPGAIGCGYKEAELTREFTKLLKKQLEKYCDVDIYDTTKNAYRELMMGRFTINKYDYVLECHFNAFNDASANGSEIFVTTLEKAVTVEKGIMKKMKKYFKLRGDEGVKRCNYAVIKNIKNHGISSALLEICFITNKNDMKMYQMAKESIALDVAVAIADGFGLKKKDVKQYYIVKKGDTLNEIAHRNNTTLTNILKLNPGIKNPNLIYINQKIRVK